MQTQNGKVALDKDDYELDEEYDLSTMKIVPKGRFAPNRRKGSNVVLLAPDVVQAFPSDEAVNEALRLVIQMMEIPTKHIKKATSKKKGVPKDKTFTSLHEVTA